MFKTATNLTAAYGVAVTGSMAITSIIISYIAYYRWKWNILWVLLVFVPFMAIDFAFFGANLLKLGSGGYFPVLIAAGLILVMLTWQWGRKSLASAFYDFGVREGKRIEWLVSLRDMLDELEITIKENLPAARSLIQGRRRLVESDRAAVFLCSRPIDSTDDYVPVVMRIFLKKYGVLPSIKQPWPGILPPIAIKWSSWVTTSTHLLPVMGIWSNPIFAGRSRTFNRQDSCRSPPSDGLSKLEKRTSSLRAIWDPFNGFEYGSLAGSCGYRLLPTNT
jgi:hypothetical protein